MRHATASILGAGLVAASLAMPSAHADGWDERATDGTLSVQSRTSGQASPTMARAGAKITVPTARLSADAGDSVDVSGSSVGVPVGTTVRLQEQLTDGGTRNVARGTVQRNGSWSLKVKAAALGAVSFRVVAKVSKRVVRSREVVVTGYAWNPLSKLTTRTGVSNRQYLIDGRVFPTQLQTNSTFRPDTLLPGALTIPAGCKKVELGGGFDNGGDGSMAVLASTSAETFLRVEVPNAAGALGVANVPGQGEFTVIATEVRWTRYNGVGTSVAYGGGQAYCSFVLR